MAKRALLCWHPFLPLHEVFSEMARRSEGHGVTEAEAVFLGRPVRQPCRRGHFAVAGERHYAARR